MSKQVAVMPSLEVLVERLPKSVLDSVIGPAEIHVSEIIKPIQQPATLKSSVKTKVLKQSDTLKSMQSLRVTLERLPKNVMTSLLAEKKNYLAQEKRKAGRPRKIKSQFKNLPTTFDISAL